MEEQKENTQSDYWLVQYQRLMDRKPQAMIDLVEYHGSGTRAPYIT